MPLEHRSEQQSVAFKHPVPGTEQQNRLLGWPPQIVSPAVPQQSQSSLQPTAPRGKQHDPPSPQVFKPQTSAPQHRAANPVGHEACAFLQRHFFPWQISLQQSFFFLHFFPSCLQLAAAAGVPDRITPLANAMWPSMLSDGRRLVRFVRSRVIASKMRSSTDHLQSGTGASRRQQAVG